MHLNLNWVTEMQLMRAEHNARKVPFGVSFLDDALNGIMPTDIVLLGAWTGVGKTQLATQIALNACRQQHPVWFFALEADKFELQHRLLHGEIYRAIATMAPARRRLFLPFRYQDYVDGDYEMRFAGDEVRATNIEDFQALERAAAKKLMRGGLEFMRIFYREKIFTPQDFLRLIRAARENDVRLIVLDHLHYFDWKRGEAESDQLSDAVKAIRELAKDCEIPVLLIAHLRKRDRASKAQIPSVDDFHGTSDISKIATKAIMLSRARSVFMTETRQGGVKAEVERKVSQPPGRSMTWMAIAKGRKAGDAIGYAGMVGFDRAQGGYGEGYDMAEVRFGDPHLIDDKKEVPEWAKRWRAW